MRLAALLLALVPPAGDDAAAPQGEPVLDPPTLRSLGVSWVVKGDANRNAKVAVEYRKPGAAAWKVGPPLFRVEKGLPKDLPEGWLFAGSLVLLEPGTAYEIRLKLSDP